MSSAMHIHWVILVWFSRIFFLCASFPALCNSEIPTPHTHPYIPPGSGWLHRLAATLLGRSLPECEHPVLAWGVCVLSFPVVDQLGLLGSTITLIFTGVSSWAWKSSSS